MALSAPKTIWKPPEPYWALSPRPETKYQVRTISHAPLQKAKNVPVIITQSRVSAFGLKQLLTGHQRNPCPFFSHLSHLLGALKGWWGDVSHSQEAGSGWVLRERGQGIGWLRWELPEGPPTAFQVPVCSPLSSGKWKNPQQDSLDKLTIKIVLLNPKHSWALPCLQGCCHSCHSKAKIPNFTLSELCQNTALCW